VNQSRVESLLEASLNTASGFLIALIVWRWVVAPLFGLPLDMASNLGVTSIFTVVSVVRSYVWRRFFNAGAKKMVKQWLSAT
jgi:hypothetical protein